MRKTFVEPMIESVDIMPSDSVMAGALLSGEARSINYVVDSTGVENPTQWTGINDGWL